MTPLRSFLDSLASRWSSLNEFPAGSPAESPYTTTQEPMIREHKSDAPSASLSSLLHSSSSDQQESPILDLEAGMKHTSLVKLQKDPLFPANPSLEPCRRSTRASSEPVSSTHGLRAMKRSIDSCTTTVDLHKPKRQKTTRIISANATASHGDVDSQLVAIANEQSTMACPRLREDIPHDYVIDEHGDLTLRLIYDGTTTDVQVCSRTLARSCKFFSILLYGPFKESYSELRTQRWVVVMQELEPETLVQILRVLHLRDTTEMRSLSGMQISDVLCMLDYLGCEKPFGDLAYAWEATIQKEASKDMKVANDRLLYAALYIGLKECFVEMMNKLQEQANNTDFWRSTSVLTSTSTTMLKHKDMSLRFRNHKPMEFDPMLQQFGLVGQLKDRRDTLWAIEQDKKQKGLELYDKRLGQYLPNKDAGKRSRANRVEEIAQGPVPSPDATAHVAIQYRLCVELRRKMMPSENFQWANHQAGSLVSCFEKLRGIDPFPPLGDEWRSLRARRMETELDKLQRAYVSTAIKYDKFDLPKCLEEFLESRRKRFGTRVPSRST